MRDCVDFSSGSRKRNLSEFLLVTPSIFLRTLATIFKTSACAPGEAGTEDEDAGDIGGSSDSILILVPSGLSSILEKLLHLFEDVKEKDV